MDIAEVDDRAVLTPASFSILLALAGGEMHGYAIMREIVAWDILPRIGPGTLYRSIKDLRAHGLIQEAEERLDPELDDQRRRYYRITPRGLRAVGVEAQRLGRLVAETAKRGFISPLPAS